MKQQTIRQLESWTEHLATGLAVVILAGGLFLASRACAVTLDMILDQPDYAVGDVLTLRLVGDPQGGTSDRGIFARLRYDSSIQYLDRWYETWPSSNGRSWSSRPLCVDQPGFVDVWSMNPPDNDWGTAYTLDQPLVTNLRFQLTRPGDFLLSFDPYFESSYQFFGASLGQYTATVRVIPEPGGGALFALGLLALAWRRRDCRAA